MEILEANLERGKKWKAVMEKAVFDKMSKDVEWMKTQKSIMKDMAAYEAYLNPIKSKEKK